MPTKYNCRSEGAYKPKRSNGDAYNKGNERESIRAWRNTNAAHYTSGPQDQSKKADLLRSVDDFLSFNQHQRQSVPDPAISDQLYRSELARDEAQAKLQEW